MEVEGSANVMQLLWGGAAMGGTHLVLSEGLETGTGATNWGIGPVGETTGGWSGTGEGMDKGTDRDQSSRAEETWSTFSVSL